MAIRTSLLRPVAATTPRSAPIAIPGPQPFRIAQSTAPLRLWLISERMEVTTIVASDVARQICIRSGVV
jgi:CRISPR/Cas system endoribonuclease Cas6 (RAMP superfamily)